VNFESLHNPHAKFCCHQHHFHDFTRNDQIQIPPLLLKNVPGIVIPRHKSYLEDIPVCDIFRYHSLKGVQRYVHEAIVLWADENRQYQLLFRTPSASEVLSMMASSTRCLTVFVEKQQLASTTTDKYPPFETRDCLSFSLHDLKHMEKYAEEKFFLEQVGFFYVMKEILVRNGEDNFCVPEYMCYDEQFNFDVEHAVADMNACVFHLVEFFKAKWIVASERNQESKEQFTARFSQFLYQLHNILPLSKELKDSLEQVCFNPNISPEDAERIRSYFTTIAKSNNVN
jgi:hypothetical protein